MAEAGSFADRVKQQADIVRVIGEYVRLKKSGQNFTGLCPFHAEKSPSFAVHPTKQIYHCFGCQVGGDVFKFVMEMEKCPFPEAIRIVAEKCGIAVPAPRDHSPEERQQNQQRTVILEMHRVAQAFFTKQLESTPEGHVARAYLEDRGLTPQVIEQFGIGYAPSGGDALVRLLRPKYRDEKVLAISGLISRDQSGRFFDRFRRRITFPIANEGGKIVAFGWESGLAGTAARALLAPFRAVAIVQSGFNLRGPLMSRGNLAVALSRPEQLPEPFDEIPIELQEHYALLGDNWASSGPGQVADRAGGLVITRALRPLHTLTAMGTKLLSILEPSFRDFCPGQVDPERIPVDRLGAGIDHDGGSINRWTPSC